ncbi:unnamed protein product [Arabidopsis lyrata]|nr:unnamed protein product [Arabidopsis lyrata]
MSRIWQYDVFISFRGDDLRHNFLAHFRKELDRKLIRTFNDMEIEKGESLDPVLTQAIRGSKIAVVLFSKNYASSGWCLNELLEIVKCKKEIGQLVIPIFHGVDPSHVRHQIGDFGSIFEKTCRRHSEEVKNQWKKALTEVANMVGTHLQNWDNEAKQIEYIVNDLLGTVILTPSKDFEDTVGIEDHIAKISLILDLKFESKEVRRVGIWGPSGIGKTTIARALYSQHSHVFDVCVFLDIHFVSKSTKNYRKGNPDDYNMKLCLQKSFLSKILDQKDIEVEHLGVIEERLKHQKVLIVLDDLDDQMVLDTLVGKDEWFGCGSRIIVITKDKRLLEAHGINHIYEVGFPSEKQALEMFCHSAFGQKSPDDGFVELATEVAARAGGLPLGLKILGKVMKNRKVEEWKGELLSLQKNQNGDIGKTLKVSYDKIDIQKHRAIFRHIACFFNGAEIDNIKLMLPELDVETGVRHLVENPKSLENENSYLIQMMSAMYLEGTNKVIGISLDLNEIDELEIHKKAFKNMHNLRFLRFHINSWEREKEVEWNLPKKIDAFPPKLKLLNWPGYPMKQLPAEFRPDKLVELRMPNSKILEKLWEGDKSLKFLKDMDLSGSLNLKEIPDLSKATNLETLNLNGCSSLVELPSSILNLNKLTDLNMAGCTNLEALPTGKLESLIHLNLAGCSRLKIFPDISNKISELIINKTAFEIFPSQLRLENLVELSLEHTMSERLWEGVQPLTNLKTIKLLGSENLKELPNLSMATSLETLNLNNCSSLVELTLSTIQNLNKLTSLDMIGCSSLETLPIGINLKSLYRLNLNGCSQLRGFPDISNNITFLFLNQTAIEEVPSHINNFSSLEALEMMGCKELKWISPGLFELKDLDEVFFSDCKKLGEVKWSEKAEDTKLSVISFTNCFYINQEIFIHQSASNYMILPGEVPPYFTHRSTGNSLTIPLHHSSLSQQPFLDFKACVVVSDLVVGSEAVVKKLCFMDIEVHCHFIDKHGNYFEPAERKDLSVHQKYNHQIIFDCRFPLNLDCDQVQIKFLLPNERLKLKRCGVRLSDDSTPFSAIQNQGYETALDEDECT